MYEVLKSIINFFMNFSFKILVDTNVSINTSVHYKLCHCVAIH